jgi:hypothetical protein
MTIAGIQNAHDRLKKGTGSGARKSTHEFSSLDPRAKLGNASTSTSASHLEVSTLLPLRQEARLELLEALEEERNQLLTDAGDLEERGQAGRVRENVRHCGSQQAFYCPPFSCGALTPCMSSSVARTMFSSPPNLSISAFACALPNRGSPAAMRSCSSDAWR